MPKPRQPTTGPPLADLKVGYNSILPNGGKPALTGSPCGTYARPVGASCYSTSKGITGGVCPPPALSHSGGIYPAVGAIVVDVPRVSCGGGYSYPPQLTRPPP